MKHLGVTSLESRTAAAAAATLTRNKCKVTCENVPDALGRVLKYLKL